MIVMTVMLAAALAAACACVLARMRSALPETAPAASGRTRPAARALAAVAAACLVAAALAPPASAGEPQAEGGQGRLSVYYLNVGQGDSELVVLPDGKTMLIDAGTAETAQPLVDYIHWLGFWRIDYLVATHPHEDHIGGMPAVLSSFDVGQVVAPEVAHDTEAFEGFLDAVAAKGLSITPAVAGLTLYDDGQCAVEVLSPAEGASHEDLNDWSAVLEVSFGGRSLLFTGDASASVVGQLGVGHVDVLKVAHHGSDTGTTPELLSQLTPSLAVIEVGAGNSYGHPTQETLDELAASGAQVWRTDLDGNVLVTLSDDGGGQASVSASSADTGAASPADPAAVAAQQAAEAASAAAVAGQGAQAVGQGPGSTTVYITNTGEKYHLDGCSSLSKSKIPISLADAVAQGYGACKRCDPPTL